MWMWVAREKNEKITLNSFLCLNMHDHGRSIFFWSLKVIKSLEAFFKEKKTHKLINAKLYTKSSIYFKWEK